MRRYRKGKTKGRTVYLHRQIMEAELNRALNWDEVVHHKNGDGSDNRIENLMLMSRKEHARHHMLKHPLVRNCEVCETPFEPKPGKRARDRSCSLACRRTLISEARSGVRLTVQILAAVQESTESQRATARRLQSIRRSLRTEEGDRRSAAPASSGGFSAS